MQVSSSRGVKRKKKIVSFFFFSLENNKTGKTKGNLLPGGNILEQQTPSSELTASL
jgi:hypothetical protein